MDFNDLIEDLKLGKNKTKQVIVKYNNKDYTISIRKLANKEINKIKEITTKPIILEGNFDTGKTGGSQISLKQMSAADMTEATYEAMITAISLSVSFDGVNFSKEEVDDLFEREIIDKLYEDIQEFNGLEEAEIKENKVIEIENFREN